MAEVCVTPVTAALLRQWDLIALSRALLKLAKVRRASFLQEDMEVSAEGEAEERR